MIRRSYDSIMSFASHRHAIWWLSFVSFIESSVFPFPPDPLFMALVLKERTMAWKIAFICTASSVLGGIVGYYIGYALYDTIGLWIIETYGFQDSFNSFQDHISTNGFWYIALKGLTPIPYKFVTICSGVVAFDFKTFIIASLIARGSRFFMLAGLLHHYGNEVKDYIENNLYFVTIAALIALVCGFILFKYLF